jgi:hypothetical protein
VPASAPGRHATEDPGRRNRAREGRAGRDPPAYLRANPSLSQEDLSFERVRTRTDFGSRGADAP